MPVRNTFVRSLHDLGAAAWFGGSLMGALGVNGAAAEVRDPTDRARVAAAGLLSAQCRPAVHVLAQQLRCPATHGAAR